MKKHSICVIAIALVILCTSARADDPLRDFNPSDSVAKLPDLVTAMTRFYTALADGDLPTAERFLAPAPESWLNPERRIREHLERRAGAKRFISFGWAPGTTDNNPPAWIVSGVFVDRDGILFLREEASSRLIRDCSFTDVWIQFGNRWQVIDGNFFRVDISAYLKQLRSDSNSRP